MTKYHCYCHLCDRQLSDSPNALSIHLTNNHGVDKVQYYREFIDSRTTCKRCGVPVPFRNLQSGYREYCPSCTVKHVQWGGERGEKRREHHRALMEARGGGASLGGAGKRKGSQNKNPYPKTEAVIRRIEQSKLLKRPYNRDPQKIAKQQDAWANKSADEMLRIKRAREAAMLAHRSVMLETSHSAIDEPTNDRLQSIFDIT